MSRNHLWRVVIAKLKVLVTGGSGYIGTPLRMALKADNYDIKDSPHKNILMLDSLDEAIKGHDVVYHLAGPVIVKESIEHPYYYWKNIFEGTKNVVNTCLKYNCRLIFTSTQLVEKRWRCGSCRRLLSPYAEAKLEAEKIIQRMMDNYLIVRLPNVYDFEDKDPYGSRLIPRLRESARKKKVVKIYPPTTDKIELVTLRKTVTTLTSCLLEDVGVHCIHGEMTTIGALAHEIAEQFEAKVVVTKEAKIWNP